MLYTFIRNAAAISENVSHFTWTINYEHRTRPTDPDLFFEITRTARILEKTTSVGPDAQIPLLSTQRQN